MVASAPNSRNASDNDVTSSPDAGSRGFVAVNNLSGNESNTSSRRSSPPDHSRRESEASPETPGSMNLPLNGQEHAGQKRKRTGSNELVADAEQRSYEFSPTRRPEPQHMANRALHVLGTGGHNTSPYYQNGVERNGHTWQPDRLAQSNSSISDMRPSPTEGQLGEGLEPESSVSETQPGPWDQQPTANGQMNPDQYNHDSGSGMPAITPKRKRNFSNRTKTGCLTCRTRKKKCDEGQPICNNCMRGGFTCKGYSVSRRNMASKGPQVKTPVPLQSKDSQGDVSVASALPRPQIDTTRPRRPPARQEGGRARPIAIEDHDQQHQHPYGVSPSRSEPPSRPPYPGPSQQPQPAPAPPQQQQQQWPSQQTSGTYTSDHLPPLSDLNRSDPAPGTRPQEMPRPLAQSTPFPPPPSTSHPGQSPVQMQFPLSHIAPHPGPPHSAPPPLGILSQPPVQWQAPPQPQYSGPIPSSAAPSHSRAPSSSAVGPNPIPDILPLAKPINFKITGREDLEKSKMLRRVHYNHLDPTLVYERARCNRALERYNAGCALDSGLSEEALNELLVKVIDPTKDTSIRIMSQNIGKGFLGDGLKIEAPFTCTYGYNLKIHDDTYIGKGCTFDDSAPIDIGPRCMIAPGVTILTTGYSGDLVHRKGTQGLWFAQDVIIAAGVNIGARAIIYPGVRIAEGVMIEPGAIVRESMKANQIHRAPPAQIMDLNHR